MKNKEKIMALGIQNYTLNNKTVAVDLGMMPILSDDSRKVLIPFGIVAAPQPLPNLEFRADRIQNIKTALFQLKAISWLKTALFTTAVAGTVLIKVYGSTAVFPVAALIVILLFAFLYVNISSTNQIKEIERQRPKQALSWEPESGVRPQKKSLKLESTITKLKQTLHEEKSLLKEEEQMLPLAYQFYTDVAPILSKRLTCKMERLPAEQKALEELNALTQFYKQFNP